MVIVHSQSYVRFVERQKVRELLEVANVHFYRYFCFHKNRAQHASSYNSGCRASWLLVIGFRAFAYGFEVSQLRIKPFLDLVVVWMVRRCVRHALPHDRGYFREVRLLGWQMFSHPLQDVVSCDFTAFYPHSCIV